MRLLTRLLLGLLVAPFAMGQSLFVDASAPPGGDGSPSSPFQTIQQAADAASAGQTIEVASGAYAPFHATKNITLIGSSPGSVVVSTALDPSQTGCSITGAPGGSGDVLIQSITFDANGVEPSQGLSIDVNGRITVTDCAFFDHTLPAGAGAGTTPDGAGAGLAVLSSVSIDVERCVFRGNSAVRGGGLWYDFGAGFPGTASIEVRECVFEDNGLVGPGSSPAGGAAIFLFSLDSPSVVADCDFRRNEVSTLVFDFPGGTIERCTFEDNGGLRDDSLIRAGSPTLGGLRRSHPGLPVPGPDRR